MLKPQNWTAEQSIAALSALRNIATLHGTAPAAPEESHLIEGVRINILEHPEQTEAQENVHLKPDDLAAAVQDDEHRERAAQVIALMPYAIRPYSDSKSYISEKYIEALGENMHCLEDFIGAREKHSKNMEYCALRKLGRDIFGTLDETTQKRVFDRLVADAEGDPAELDRYKSLESYPKGSLGRAFYDFYAQFDWPLPGDPLWISEELTVRHDLVHVLCEYDISIRGEFQVAGFSAGNSTKFNWMVAMLGFTPPYVSTGQQFQSEDFIAAYRRGENAVASFVDHWEFWPEMSEQLDDLRKTYQI
jgi:hypothetical protein